MDPGQLLKHGKAVCQGYAALLRDMCTEAGLECVMITGYARNAPEDIGRRMKKLEPHAWNAIKLGGEWILCDATWASGTFDKKTKKYTEKFNESYFLSPPEFFSRTHYPEEKKWQLLDKKVSRWKFLRRPVVWSGYDSLGLTSVSGRKYRWATTAAAVRLSYTRPPAATADSVTFGLDPRTPYYQPRLITNSRTGKVKVRLPLYKRGLHYVTMFVNHKAVATYKIRTWGIDPDKIKARREKREKKRQKK